MSKTVDVPVVEEAAEPRPPRGPQDQLDRLFQYLYDRIGTHHEAVSGHVVTGYRPPTDVTESDIGWRVAMEIPGLDADDVEILAAEGRLTVTGERAEERGKEGRTYILRERAFGRFQRTFGLPEGLEPEQARATFRNGLLTISVPRAAAAKRQERKIEITRG